MTVLIGTRSYEGRLQRMPVKRDEVMKTGGEGHHRVNEVDLEVVCSETAGGRREGVRGTQCSNLNLTDVINLRLL